MTERLPSLRMLLLLLVLANVASIAGCATPPARPLELQVSYRQLVGQSFDDPRVSALLDQSGVEHPAAGAPWSLDALTCAAWALRPEITEAHAALRVAIAQSRGKLEKPNPILNFTPEYFYDAVAGSAPWTVAIALSSLLSPTRGQISLKQQSDALQLAASWSVAESVWSVRSEVRAALIEYAERGEQLKLLNAERALREDAAQLAQTIYALGASDNTARRRAATALADAAARERAAGHAQELALTRLAHAIGVAAEQWNSHPPAALLRDELETRLATDAEADRQRAATDRIDIARALAQYSASDAAWRVAVAQRSPGISLGSGAALDRGEHKLTADLGIELPLYNRHQAAIDEAAASRDVAVQRLQALQLQAIGEVDQAHAALRAAAADLEASRAAQTAAAQWASTEAQRQRVGAGDRGAVLEARLALNVADWQLLDAQERQIQALSQLENALQRPLWPRSDIDLQRQSQRADGAPAISSGRTDPSSDCPTPDCPENPGR